MLSLPESDSLAMRAEGTIPTNFENVVAHPGKELLRGFVVLIVVPVGIVLALTTLLGGMIAMLVGFAYIFFVTLAVAYAGVVFGAWMQKLFEKEEPLKVSWKNALAGVLVLTVIVFVPFIGFFVGLFFFLATFGSVTHLAYEKFWVNR